MGPWLGSRTLLTRVFWLLTAITAAMAVDDLRRLNLDLPDLSSDSHEGGGGGGGPNKGPAGGHLLPPATLLASTLDGTLVALNKADGAVLWQLNDEPAVRAPHDPNKSVLPAFLPDPKDGSLYMLAGSGKGSQQALKRLPWTIPELVAASPCKSTDGILYTGRKVDLSVARYLLLNLKTIRQLSWYLLVKC